MPKWVGGVRARTCISSLVAAVNSFCCGFAALHIAWADPWRSARHQGVCYEVCIVARSDIEWYGGDHMHGPDLRLPVASFSTRLSTIGKLEQRGNVRNMRCRALIRHGD